MYSVRKNNISGLMKLNRWSFVFIYAVFVFFAAVFLFLDYYEIFNEHRSALSGVGLIVVGLPWSLIDLRLGGMNLFWISIIGGIILNGLIFRLIGEMIYRTDPGRGVVIVILGIIGLISLGPILGIPAWIMGYKDLKKIEMKIIPYSQKGITKVGMIIGIVATFNLLPFLIMVLISDVIK